MNGWGENIHFSRRRWFIWYRPVFSSVVCPYTVLLCLLPISWSGTPNKSKFLAMVVVVMGGGSKVCSEFSWKIWVKNSQFNNYYYKKPRNLRMREKIAKPLFIKISQPRVFNSEVHTPRRLCGVNYNVKGRGSPVPPVESIPGTLRPTLSYVHMTV